MLLNPIQILETFRLWERESERNEENSGQAISSTAEKGDLHSCAMTRHWSHGHIWLQAGLENIVSRWVAKGKKIRFWEHNWLCPSPSLFFICLYSLSHASPFYAFGLPSQSVLMFFLTSKLNLSKQFMCRNTTFFREECLITPAKSNLLNSHRYFFFILYFLITETYILLLIWVHALSHLETTCSKIIVPLLY